MFKLLNLSNNSLVIFREWTYENCSKEWCRESIYKHVFQPFLVRKVAALREHKPYAIFCSYHSSRPLANKENFVREDVAPTFWWGAHWDEGEPWHLRTPGVAAPLLLTSVGILWSDAWSLERDISYWEYHSHTKYIHWLYPYLEQTLIFIDQILNNAQNF